MERFLDFQFQKEISLLPLFLNQCFRAAAVSLLSTFSAIYVFKVFLEKTGHYQKTLLIVVLFFGGIYFFKLISTLFSEELSLRLGLKKQIYVGLFFLFLSLISLIFSRQYWVLFFLASPLWGISAGFYWFGRHGLFVKLGKDKDYGKELAMAEALDTILLLGIPFLGGSLILLVGYEALFLVALFFVFLAGVVTSLLPEQKTHYDTSLKEVLELFKTHKKIMVGYMANSTVGTIYSIAIPLYLFLILKEEFSLGSFFSLSMILVAFIHLIIGRWSDIKGKRELISFGSIAGFFFWLGRAFTANIKILFALDVLERATSKMIGIPLVALSYQKALDGRSTARALLFREVAIASGSILACFLFLITTYWGFNFKTLFMLTAGLSLIPLLIARSESGTTIKTFKGERK